MTRPPLGLSIVACFLALTLTVWSAAYMRVGATYVVEGEAWCPTAAPCTVRTLGAGFPLPYLADDPQVSIPGSVSPIEDDFRPGAFLVDVLFWLVVIAVVIQIVSYRRRKRVEADPTPWDTDRRPR